jgi:transposase
MSNLFWPTEAQMERLKPFFPTSHGKPRVDVRRVPSGMIYVNRNGLRWCDAPKGHGRSKTLDNRRKRWGRADDAPRVQANLRGWGSSPG